MGSALRVPLLRGRARPRAKRAAADESGSAVRHRRRNAPVTAPRRGVRQIGSGLWPACVQLRPKGYLAFGDSSIATFAGIRIAVGWSNADRVLIA
jgi:hypothetical protein